MTPGSTPMIVHPDPVTRVWRFLNPHYPGLVFREEPDGPDRDPQALLILVKDAGGDGHVHRMFSDARITLEVHHQQQRTAAEQAARVDALLRAWPYTPDGSGVYWLAQYSRPTYWPDPERRIPAYVWTVGFRFKGEKTTIQPT